MNKPQSEITFRAAMRADLAAIVELLANDELGQMRESVTKAAFGAYARAFDAIDADPNNEIIVVEDTGGVCATMQLSFIPNLTFEGATRCQIEGVRVAERRRGQGVGRQMVKWATTVARKRGCGIVQLTSNKTRADALRFYEDLGFTASHVGFKLYLDQAQ